MRKDAERWMAFAADDLRAAEVLCAEGVWGQACFHAQQAAEKALKALLASATGEAPPRTHGIAELLFLLPETSLSAIRAELAESLDDYYLPTRYPDALPGSLPDGLPGRDEALEALSLAQRTCAEARRLLNL